MEKSVVSNISTKQYFTERYGELYLNQMAHLKKLITQNSTGKNKFTVVGIEAGLGKSLETDRILDEDVNKDLYLGRRYLIVKRLITDIQSSVTSVNYKSIHGEVALGITHENWDDIQKDLFQIEMYPIIYITQARYWRLSVDSWARSFFQENRDTLIIDEQLELPVYSFSNDIFKELNGSMPSHTLVPKLLAVCEGLFAELKRLEQYEANNRLLKAKPLVNIERIKEFEKDFRANWYHFNEDVRSKVENFVNFLYAIQSNTCLYNQGRLSTYNKDAHLWTLSNNLILDASASIDKRYKLSSNFDVDMQSWVKVIDRSNSTFNSILFNPSKSNIKRVQSDYYNQICSLIKDRHASTDKTLIVTHNQHEKFFMNVLRQNGFHSIGVGDKYNGEEIAVAHFGAIIGQNYWRNFNKVWIIASPNIPMEIYPLYWAFVKQSPIRNHSLQMSGIKGQKGKFIFHNKDFNSIRQGCLVSEIYQAIMRINRRGELASDIYVVHGDQDVINDVKQQLKNVKIGETIELDIKPNKEKKETSGKVTKNVQFVQLIKQLPPGVYQKRELYKRLGWKYDGNMSKYLNDKEIQEMEQAKLIHIGKTTITIYARAIVAK